MKIYNFIEAMKTGRIFRVRYRDGDYDGCTMQLKNSKIRWSNGADFITEKVLDADFILKEKKIDITESDLEEFFESIKSGMLYEHAKENIGFDV